MANPKDSRNQLRLSRRNFAKLLDCTEKELAMAEAGKKELPESASSFLEEIEAVIAQTQGEPIDPAPIARASVFWLENEIKQSEATKLAKQAQLNSIMEEARQLQSLMHAPHLVKDDARSVTSYAQDMQLFELKKQVAQELMGSYSKIAELKVDIICLDIRIKGAKGLKTSF